MPQGKSTPQSQKGKLYEQLLDFFASTIFQMPVLNFIDQNCMIFCSENEDNPEYREVHLQYKSLVSALIGAFCEDSKMKYEDFISALSDFSDRAKGFEGTALKAVYEQVLAAENYNLFVNLMLRHNVELQQQCLLLILKEIGNLPPSVIAAATGASVETLQALVASAQSGGGGEGAGTSGKSQPEDQELAVLMAALKDTNLKDQPSTSSSAGGQAKTAPNSSSQAQVTKPDQPASAKPAAASGGDETVEKVAELVDQMANKRAGYDKRVEQEESDPPPIPDDKGGVPKPAIFVSGSMQYYDSESTEESELSEQPSSTTTEGKQDSPVIDSSPELRRPPERPTPKRATAEESKPKAMLSEETAPPSTNKTVGASSGSSLSSLPPLPGVTAGPLGKGAAGGKEASMDKISAMLQPLGSGGSADQGDTSEMLKNPATQRALEALKSMNADDLVARSEYLKAQRDRLLTLKQKQRKNLLDAETQKQGSARPKSARISKQFIDDDKPGSELSAEDEERLRVRRAINDSIRREMMASKDK